MCNKFSKVSIEMHGEHQVDDPQFIDLMHLTSIINMDEMGPINVLSPTPAGAPAQAIKGALSGMAKVKKS